VKNELNINGPTNHYKKGTSKLLSSAKMETSKINLEKINISLEPESTKSNQLGEKQKLRKASSKFSRKTSTNKSTNKSVSALSTLQAKSKKVRKVSSHKL
jgi:hypothetical protein